MPRSPRCRRIPFKPSVVSVLESQRFGFDFGYRFSIISVLFGESRQLIVNILRLQLKF